MNEAFVASTAFPIDRVLWLAALAAVALAWFLKKPGSPRLLIVIGAAVAALATIGTYYTVPGGVIHAEDLGAVERRPPSILWMVCYFLENGGRLTALIGFAWATLKDDAPGNLPK